MDVNPLVCQRHATLHFEIFHFKNINLMMLRPS